ncbi:hypothetical protein GOODEAATRI_029700, partial [Goodea atripinnis]
CDVTTLINMVRICFCQPCYQLLLCLSSNLFEWMICRWNHLHMTRPVATFLFRSQKTLHTRLLLSTPPACPHRHLLRPMERPVRCLPPHFSVWLITLCYH